MTMNKISVYLLTGRSMNFNSHVVRNFSKQIEKNSSHTLDNVIAQVRKHVVQATRVVHDFTRTSKRVDRHK